MIATINEATPAADIIMLDMANDAYEAVAKRVKAKKYDRDRDGIRFVNLGDIMDNHPDLYVVFTTEGGWLYPGSTMYIGEKYTFGYEHDSPPRMFIFCPIIPDDRPDTFSKIDKESFIHEYIHFLDRIRYKNKDRKINQQTADMGEYLNTPEEFNAWFQTALKSVVDHLNANPDIRTTIHRSFPEFYKYFMRHVPYEMAVLLRGKYREKMLKRIHKVYDYIKEKYKDVDEALSPDQLKSARGYYLPNPTKSSGKKKKAQPKANDDLLDYSKGWIIDLYGRDIYNDFVKLRKELRKISWKDIIIKSSGWHSVVVGFTDPNITNLYKKLRRKANPEVSIGDFHFSGKANIAQAFNDLKRKGTRFANIPRPHWSDGLGEFLNGIGLAYKIYKAMLFDRKVIMSDSNASNAVQHAVYQYFLQDPDIYNIYLRNESYLMANTVTTEEIVGVLAICIGQYISNDDVDDGRYTVEKMTDRFLKDAKISDGLVARIGGDAALRKLVLTIMYKYDDRYSPGRKFRYTPHSQRGL